MKHPPKRILQDYLEAELDPKAEIRLRAHVELCDECSNQLADLAAADELFKRSRSLEVDNELWEKVFSQAAPLLEERRGRRQLENARSQKRQELFQRFSRSLKDVLDFAAHEARLPAIQVASLSLFLFMVAQAKRFEEKTIEYKPIETDVGSYGAVE